uniref:GTPase Der n=1 Tax=Candidatus Aschnera chinzeii TaxID=1485666 RepID=A0AAT9G5A0_9ENTR|nr:MAG: ribosome biogenesis GTPase Der [Candidatus Aschnera chinzeii]
MIPTIILLGRTNVGKSTLFNNLTHSKTSLVSHLPNTTRDIKSGEIHYNGKKIIIIDTAGLEESYDKLQKIIWKKIFNSIQGIDIILYVLDAKSGLTKLDIIIIDKLRIYNKIINLIINKIDNIDYNGCINDCYSLGIKNIFPISAISGIGLHVLIKKIITYCNLIDNEISFYRINDNFDRCFLSKNIKKQFLSYIPTENKPNVLGVNIAVIGKTNVGKSTLINCIVGENRVIVSSIPGTTHDTVCVPIIYNGLQYNFIDTAGINNKWKVKDEKLFIYKAFKLMRQSTIILVLINADSGIFHQDLVILNYAITIGRAIVIAINKIDTLSQKEYFYIKKQFIKELKFIEFAKINFISALHGTGIKKLLHSINLTYQSAVQQVHTSTLTRILKMAEKNYPPPITKTYRAKIKYAHAGGYNPFILIIHGNQVYNLPDFYRRYLINFFRNKLHFVGVCIKLKFIEGKNPYLK